MSEVVVERSYYPGVLIGRVVNLVIGVIEALLALRIVLELLGASPASSFIAWIYSLTDSVVGPFAGAFPNLLLGGGFVIDLAAILAMVAYAILGWLIVRLVWFVLP